MITFFVGLALGVAVFGLIVFGGRTEPTHHGQLVIAELAVYAGIIATVVAWLVGFLIWLF